MYHGFYVILPNNYSISQLMRNIYLQLFLTFLKIGAFTFGGGWVMISIIEREVVNKHKWISREDFLDLLAVAQSLPGILAVNFAVAIGDKLRGSRGRLCAALGTIIPSFTIILLIAIFLTPETIKNNETISKIFMGMRPAVVALLIAPVITTARAAKINWKTIFIPISVALLIWSKLPYISNPIIYIILGGLGGYLWYIQHNYDKRKEGQNDIS